MRNSNVKAITLGGLLAAVAVVIMCLGTYIPVATYVCPVLCCVVAFIVLKFSGHRIAWTWYVVVCILCLLLAPDKEAVMVFLAVGTYPMLKPVLEKSGLAMLWKLLFFNASVLCVYGIMIYLMGMSHLLEENAELGNWGMALLLLLGNITFFLLDRVLTMIAKKK